MARVTTTKRSPANGTSLGFEATLWATTDKLRGNLDAAEYKHVVLGLIFLKYISDAFEEKQVALQKEKGADPEDRDEYLAENVFWVPPEARWSYLQGRAKDPVIGKLLDNAMVTIERDDPSLKNRLPKDYTRPHLDKQSLDGVIDLRNQVEAELAADYLSQAERLISEGVRGQFDHVAAAVLVGAVLEKALRTLCGQQHPSIPLMSKKGQPKTLNPLIDDLKKAGLYMVRLRHLRSTDEPSV